MDKKTASSQKFKIKRIHREQLKEAEYNPRFIDGEAKKRLSKNIKNVGLLETLVWNERTGNLISGHQRLSILDKIEKGTDYYLDVAVVDLDEVSEKE